MRDSEYLTRLLLPRAAAVCLVCGSCDQPQDGSHENPPAASTGLSGVQEHQARFLTFDRPQVNLDRFHECDLIRQSFTFRNALSSEVEVDHINASCGCSTERLVLIHDGVEKAYDWNTSIRPGQEGVLYTTLDTYKMRGEMNGRFALFARDSDKPLAVLQVSFEVAPLFDVSPPRVYLGELYARKGGESLVAIRHLQGRSFEIASWENLPPTIELVPELRDARHGDRTDLTVRFLPGMPLGIFHHDVTLRTVVEGVEERRIRLEISGVAQGPLRASPRPLGFGVISAGSRHSVRAQIENRDAEFPLEIRAVRIESEQREHLSAQVFEKQKGALFEIELQAAESCPQGIMRGMLILETNLEDTLVPKIPFSGIVR